MAKHPTDEELGQAQRLVRIVNAKRLAVRRDPLVQLEALDNAAWLMVVEMQKRTYQQAGYPRGLDPQGRAWKAGYRARPVAEVCAHDINPRVRRDSDAAARGVVGRWLQAKDQQSKILHGRAVACGAAYRGNSFVLILGTQYR